MIKKRVSLFIILVAVLLLFSSCGQDSSVNNKHILSIYLVKNLSTIEAMSRDIDKLLLETAPV